MTQLNAAVPLFTELKSSDDDLLELIAHRFSQVDSLEQAEQKLITKNLELIVERNAANKVVRELSEQNKGMANQLENSEVVKEGLQAALEALDPEFEKLLSKIAQLESENSTLLGRVDNAIKSLKAIKKLGNPEDLIALNKKMRATNSELTKNVNNLKAENRKLSNDNQRLQEVMVKTAHEKGDERLLFTSKTNEVLYLNPQLLTIKSARGTFMHVGLRYWSAQGLGRLVTWNGSLLNFADTKNAELNKLVAPSREIQDFATGWFKKHVTMVDGNQELKIQD